MSESLECLLMSVHYLDQRMAALAADLQRLALNRQENQKELKGLEARVQEIEARIKQSRLQENLLEGKRKSLALQDEKLKTKIYAVKTPRELDALNNQKAKLDSDVAEIEESLLEVMESLEGDQSTLEEVRARLGKVREEQEPFLNALADQEKSFKKQGGACLKRRAQLAEQLPVTNRDHYERVMKNRGKAVAAIGAEHNCPCCSFEIPKNSIATLSSGNGPVHCRECGIYLCWDFGNFGYQCSLCGQTLDLTDSARVMAQSGEVKCRHCEGV